jgi:hypothetical protein
MTAEEPKNSKDSEEDREPKVHFHVSPDLDYVYRDVVNIFVGSGEVVFEFGNRHRSIPNHVSISNRIVLSIANAYEFQQRLQQALQEAHMRMQQQIRPQK